MFEDNNQIKTYLKKQEMKELAREVEFLVHTWIQLG